MMRRLLWLIGAGLIAAISAATIDAQGLTFRRKHRASSNPVCVIDTPTDIDTFQATASPVTVSGTCTVTSGRSLSSVTWQNLDTLGTGTMVLSEDTGRTRFTASTSGGSALTVYNDDFDSASNVDLSTLTPNTGTACTELVDSAGNNSIIAIAGYIRPNSVSTAGHRIIYRCTGSPAVSGTNYDVLFKQVAQGGTNVAGGAIFRLVDGDNHCGLVTLPASANPDLILFKVVAGVATTLGTANAGVVSQSVIRIKVRTGGIITVQDDDVDITGLIGVTDAFCDDDSRFGIGFGAINRSATYVVSTDKRYDDLTVTDQDGGATNGITIQAGLNRIVITGTDSAAATGTDQINVTLAGADTTDPTGAIDSPAAEPYLTATAALTVSGSCADNVACLAPTWTCPQCATTSGTATGTASWSFALTLGCSAAPGTTNVVTVTLRDAAGNDLALVRNAVCVSADVTDPTISVTSPASSPHTATSSTVAFTGAASDAGSGIEKVTWACDICSTPSGIASGQGPWFQSIVMAAGTNNLTFTAYDFAGNTADVTFVVNWTPPLSMTTTAMPAATVGSVYSFCPSATGGTAPLSYSRVSGSYPTGLSFASGCVTGTPAVGQEGSYVGHVYRVTDGAAQTDDTPSMTLTVVVAGTGPHAFFEAALLRADFYRGYSWRPIPGTTCTSGGYTSGIAPGEQGVSSGGNGQCNPYMATQLNTKANGGYSDNNTRPVSFTYSPSTDTDPEAQDAAKFVVEAFVEANTPAVLETAVAATPATGTITLRITSSTTLYAGLVHRGFKIGNEILICDESTDFDPTRSGIQCARSGGGTLTEVQVLRAQGGTSAAAHSAGASVLLSGNSLRNQLRPVIGGTADGNTYVFIWDFYWPQIWMDPNVRDNLTNWKAFQLSGPGDSRNFVQLGAGFDGQSTLDRPACWGGRTVHVGVPMFQSSGPSKGGVEDFTLTNGRKLGPGITNSEEVRPHNELFCVEPSKWTRYWMRIQQRANDYEWLDIWIGDEDTEPLLIYQTPLNRTSLYDPSEFYPTGFGNESIEKFWYELNTSTDKYRGNQADLTGYIRNLIVLKKAGTSFDLAAEGLLVKPLPGPAN